MKTRTGFSLAVVATAILLLCQAISPAIAQDQGPPPNQGYDQGNAQPNDQDPPTRAGRISFTEGSVSFQPGGQGDWLDAVRNRPLTVGDNLWVDKDSRAEIQIGSTSIRLGPETSISFLDLGNNVTQLRLSLGSLFVRVRHFDRDDTFEVDTPNLAFNVNQAGEFRLDANQNGDQTIATVFRGSGEITGGGNSYRLNEGQQGTFSGTDQLSYDVGEIQESDSFSRWCLSRDEREDRIRSSQYVSSDMTGYEDLDDYGRWRSVPDYGYVWTPAGVPGDWAPYRYGHWAYVYPWGWTWVEDEPWGFAPFHYGRWAFVEGGWCWVPGPVAVAPVYAPALVAFVGGFSIGIGSEPVGWFPLAPREVFVPWYRTSPTYVENVNITNTHVTVVQVNNVYNNYTVNHVTNVTYVNQRVTNSVTVVNHDTFVNARPVNQNVVRVDSRQLASARVSPAVATRAQPARQSVIGVAHPVQFRPPAQALSRPVVATRQPVALSRPAAAAPPFVRPAPAPVRTVRAAPPAQAQALQRGARGGPPNNPGANRPPSQPNMAQPSRPENRGEAPRPGAPAGQPNAPENRGQVPRPGAPVNNPQAGQRPGGPENNRNNVPRPGGPPTYNAPAARPNENAPRPGAPENRPAQPENRNAPPENGRPGQQVPRPPSSQERAPEQQPRQYPGTRPENNRPQEPPQAQPSRPAEASQSRPEQPARPPEFRQQPAPRQPESRPQPQTEQRSAPRPEARPAEPPPQREARPAPPSRNEQPPRQEKPPKEKEKEPPK
jgi:hypothetical protein